jgi:hypothetical protein
MDSYDWLEYAQAKRDSLSRNPCALKDWGVWLQSHKKLSVATLADYLASFPFVLLAGKDVTGKSHFSSEGWQTSTSANVDLGNITVRPGTTDGDMVAMFYALFNRFNSAFKEVSGSNVSFGGSLRLANIFQSSNASERHRYESWISPAPSESPCPPPRVPEPPEPEPPEPEPSLPELQFHSYAMRKYRRTPALRNANQALFDVLNVIADTRPTQQGGLTKTILDFAYRLRKSYEIRKIDAVQEHHRLMITLRNDLKIILQKRNGEGFSKRYSEIRVGGNAATHVYYIDGATLFITSGRPHSTVYTWDITRLRPAIDKIMELRERAFHGFNDSYLFVHPRSGTPFACRSAMDKAFRTCCSSTLKVKCGYRTLII